MSKLNKIFYGPAGTGKTRGAIEEAISIVKDSLESKILNLQGYNFSNFNEKINFFQSISNLPELKIEHPPLLKDIQNLNKSIDEIFSNKSYRGHLGDSKEDREESKKNILKYRSYPLVEMVTFHPSYSYQDFVEGITVEMSPDKKNIEYKVKDGIFKKICKRAEKNRDYNYVLIIDEINRGDISSIFGELFTLIEDKKRLGESEELRINLPYSKDSRGNPEKLGVPKNLYILATMNTVDKSIALMDVALRRRFEFIECMPKYDLDEFKREVEGVNLSKLLKAINDRIAILKNEHYQIGHSYFLDIKNFKDIKEIFITKIIPLLQEYFYDDWQSICAVLNQSYRDAKEKGGILELSNMDRNIFNNEFEELIEFRNKKVFKVNPNFTKEDLMAIYK